MELALDVVLVLALVYLALRAIHAPELFTGAVLYIVFGVVMAVVWVRLGAPDLAIAEAAIGAGITGSLLLGAVREFGEAASPHERVPRIRAGAAAAGAIGIAVLLSSVFLTLGDGTRPIQRFAVARLGESGVSHAITAVLLNFRAYDTGLEMGVLLVAAVAVLVLRDGFPPDPGPPLQTPAVLGAAAAGLAPVGVLTAGFLLWRGSHGPGGAFQAGAVLAAIGVLLSLVGRPPLAGLSSRTRRVLLTAGFLAFLAVGIGAMAMGGAFLELPTRSAGWLIVVVEAAMTVSVGATLLLLFDAARPGADAADPDPR